MGLSHSVCNVVLLSLWKLLHFLVSVYFFFVFFLWKLNFFERFLGIYYSKRAEELGKSDARNFAKLPVHLGLVFSEDARKFSVENMANLLIWSSNFGISFVSIYDRKGFWREKKEEIHFLLEKKMATSTRSWTGSCIQIAPSDNKLNPLSSYGTESNSLIGLPGTNLIFLSESDGKSTITLAAKDICNDVSAGRLDLHAIDQNLLDSFIHRYQDFPDPDLVIKFGNLDSLSGYLPWQIRLSAIMFAPHPMEMSFRDFRSALWKFSRVQQRVGR